MVSTLIRFGAEIRTRRARTARGIVDGCGCAGLAFANADELRYDAADLSGRVELALALATLGGKMSHQVLVSISQYVVALGAIIGEVEGRVLEDGDEIGEAIDLVL